MTSVDIIVPCYNEAEGLPLFYRETENVFCQMTGYSFTYYFVDDGSSDQTLPEIRKLAKTDNRVKFLSFSRNFGKEAAMYAGLQASRGELVIIMDADLQHPPAMIPVMMEGIKEGYDCAAAMRSTRTGESPVRSFFSRGFYRINNWLSNVKMPYGAVDFRIMTRQMVNAVLQLCETERFSKGIFAWVGFETKWYPYENVERTVGKSKWKFRGLFHYALDGLTAFSVTPLRLVSFMGIFIFAGALIYIIATLIQTLIFGIAVPGYVTTLCAVLFLGGIIEFSIGIVGEYVAHMYIETKKRPVYLVKMSNLDSKETEDP